MNPDIIGEAWQAMSVLSDAQEFLGDGQANDLINHAKRHLIRAFELTREEDADAFRKAIMLIDCTLQLEEHAPAPGASFVATLLQQVEEHIASHGASCVSEKGCYREDAAQCGGKGLFILREAIEISLGGKR